LTPLHLVCFKGQDEYLSILLENEIDINSLDLYYRSPIVYSIMEGQLNCAYMLLDKGCDIYLRDIEGNSLLHYAVSSKGNCILLSNMLIDRKIDLNMQNYNGDTPLMLIAKNNPKENVRLLRKLLSCGAEYKDIINYKGQSFLSLMGEFAIKNNFCKEKINIEEENEKACKRIINNIFKEKKDKKLTKYIFPFILLLIAIILQKLS
jgi:ankyrin repeat protein